VRRGLWFLAGWLTALVVVIVLYNVGLSTPTVVEAPVASQPVGANGFPAEGSAAPTALSPASGQPPAVLAPDAAPQPVPTFNIPLPQDESEANYFAWLGEATLRLRYVSATYQNWVDRVTAAFPDVPDTVRDTGRWLQADWIELGAAVDSVTPPDHYRQVHSRLSDGIKLYGDSTTKLYEALVEQDPNRLNAGIIFGNLAERAVEPVLQLAPPAPPTLQPAQVASATPAPEPTTPALTLPHATPPSDARTVTPFYAPTLLAVVMAESLNVRSGPGAEYELVGTVTGGTELVIDGRSSSGVWVHGRVPGQDVEGWFSAIGSMIVQGGVMELPVLD
jgi:hypothetical protein